MSNRIRPRYLLAALVLLAGCGIWAVAIDAGNDRLAAILAGAAVCTSLCLGPRLLGYPLLSPPMLYLSVFALFHLGMALPWALGLYEGVLPRWFLSNRLSPALALVALAATSYVAGLLLISRPPLEERPGPVYTNRFFFWSGMAIYAAGSIMFFLGVDSLGGQRFFDAGYGETYRLAAQFDPRFFGTSFTIVPIGLYLAAASFERRGAAFVFAITLLWVCGIFFLGFRGFALIPGLVVLALVRQRGYRSPAWLNVGVLLLVLVAIPAARAVRDQGVRRRSLDRTWQRIHLLDGVIEMGGSLRPLVHTIHYVENEPWRWGKTYWQSFETVWPNLARRWEGGRYIALQDLPPNHWLTAQAEPDMYRHYGGLGFSAVAEPYMNFGVPGVLLYFCALGALLARAARFHSTRPVRLAAWAMVLGPLLWTTRNSFEIFFRPAIWGLLIVAALRFASGLVPYRHARAGS